jgi:hypothetical protein
MIKVGTSRCLVSRTEESHRNYYDSLSVRHRNQSNKVSLEI